VVVARRRWAKSCPQPVAMDIDSHTKKRIVTATVTSYLLAGVMNREQVRRVASADGKSQLYWVMVGIVAIRISLA
jgi:hypothetical protein